MTYSNREIESLKLWIELIRCSGALEHLMDGRLRRHYGQSMARFDVLSQLERAPEHGLAVGALANQLIASKGNITRLLDRMVNDELVTRAADPNDRRRYRITITDKGLALFETMAADHASWVQDSLKSLDPRDMNDMAEKLKKARENIVGLDRE